MQAYTNRSNPILSSFPLMHWVDKDFSHKQRWDLISAVHYNDMPNDDTEV